MRSDRFAFPQETLLLAPAIPATAPSQMAGTPAIMTKLGFPAPPLALQRRVVVTGLGLARRASHLAMKQSYIIKIMYDC